MDTRRKIGIYFRFNYNQATGLTIYIINIVRILNTLEDKRKPHLTIIHDESSPVNDIKAIGYPYLSFYEMKHVPVHLSILQKVINKINRLLFNSNYYRLHQLEHPFPNYLETIYPYFNIEEASFVKNKIYWKADFQENYYPEFFTNDELRWVKEFMGLVSTTETTLVLSSEDASNDYNKFYSNHKSKVKLLRFASFLPDFQYINIEKLKAKYNIQKKYFFIANQFWPHKNHITVLKAINEIKEKNLNIEFVFSGKTSSYRDSSYFPSLKKYTEEYNINSYVNFIGFIPREEQLQLMKHAVAIIQPTLFEGWSTVIEDAKAMNQFVIASDLRVNIEQINDNCAFFKALDYQELAGVVERFTITPPEIVLKDYQCSLDKFRDDIIDILEIV